MKKDFQQRKTARFRYWTRKGYAAFSSLGLCVTIGQLRKNVTERSLKKQNGLSLLLPTDRAEGDEQTNDKEPDTLPALNEALLLTVLCKQVETTSTYPANPLLVHSINRSINASNAFCRSLFPVGTKRSKTHSAYLYPYSPYFL